MRAASPRWICRLREARIAEVETFLSDVPGMNPGSFPARHRRIRAVAALQHALGALAAVCKIGNLIFGGAYP